MSYTAKEKLREVGENAQFIEQELDDKILLGTEARLHLSTVS